MSGRWILRAVILFATQAPLAAQGYWYYYWGQLNTYANGAQACTVASVPFGCVNRSELELTRESETVDSRSGDNCCWGCSGGSVYLWVENQDCLPPQTWYAASGEAEFVLPDYGWTTDSYWDGRATPPSQVDVTSASIPSDQITVELSPCGGYGELVVTITGDTTVELYRGSRGGGTQVVSFNIPALPNGKTFQQVRAEWTPQDGQRTATRGYGFKVLGDYLHTQYNSVLESACSGSLVPLRYVTGDCVYVQSCDLSSFSGKNMWWQKVRENGSGWSDALSGVVSREYSCGSGSDRGRRVPSPCAHCPGMSLNAYQTVARVPYHPELQCGDVVFIFGLGLRTVADQGENVAVDQLDHFIGFTGCNQATTYGRRKTVKLLGGP